MVSMLDELLAANRTFLERQKAGKSTTPFTGPARQLAIVTCMDARLLRLLPEALDLASGDAIMIRNAGNTLTRWDESIPRSVAAAVYLQGVRHVAVIGHTDCRMCGDTLTLIDAMRQVGISRSALGDRDPREVFGMFASVDSNVRAVIDALRRTPLLPGGIALYGLVIDTQTGELKTLARESTAGQVQGAKPDARMTPRKGDSLEKVLGVSILDSFVPKAGFVPSTDSPPAVEVPAPPSSGAPSIVPPSKSAPAQDTGYLSADARQKTVVPPLPTARPNVRRDPEVVPVDPRAAQEFFRQREQERLRKKRPS
jgi:carbonic anhydrase